MREGAGMPVVDGDAQLGEPEDPSGPARADNGIRAADAPACEGEKELTIDAEELGCFRSRDEWLRRCEIAVRRFHCSVLFKTTWPSSQGLSSHLAASWLSPKAVSV